MDTHDTPMTLPTAKDRSSLKLPQLEDFEAWKAEVFRKHAAKLPLTPGEWSVIMYEDDYDSEAFLRGVEEFKKNPPAWAQPKREQPEK